MTVLIETFKNLCFSYHEIYMAKVSHIRNLSLIVDVIFFRLIHKCVHKIDIGEHFIINIYLIYKTFLYELRPINQIQLTFLVNSMLRPKIRILERVEKKEK